jgi:3-methylfumaryl-CoA hydratase
VEHVFATQRGDALREVHNIVYRPAATEPAAVAAPGPAPTFDLEWQVPIDPVLLFRYSALTFNGHRIHYDEPYAREVEFYPGLVIHGPLQATLMLNLAASFAKVTPRQFRFRGVAV